MASLGSFLAHCSAIIANVPCTFLTCGFLWLQSLIAFSRVLFQRVSDTNLHSGLFGFNLYLQCKIVSSWLLTPDLWNFNLRSSSANSFIYFIQLSKIKVGYLKVGVHVNRSEIWSITKRELLGLKWFGHTTRQLITPNESPRLVGDCLVSVY